MRMLGHWTITMVVVSLVFPCDLAVICAGVTMFCEKLPDSGDKDTAVFLGVVKQVNYPTVEFEVTESFTIARLGTFELQIISDFYVNAIAVAGWVSPSVGQTWLVEAKKNKRTLQWFTSECQRTKRLSEAKGDLDTLRLWIAGTRPTAWVHGEVFDGRHGVPAAAVYLRGEGDSYSTTTDLAGHFAFDALEPGKYEATTDQQLQSPSPFIIHLVQAWCSPHIVLRVK